MTVTVTSPQGQTYEIDDDSIVFYKEDGHQKILLDWLKPSETSGKSLKEFKAASKTLGQKADYAKTLANVEWYVEEPALSGA